MFIFNIIFSIFCFFLLQKAVLNIREWFRSRNIINKLPGPKGLPILGNYFEFRGDRKNVFKKFRIYARMNIHFSIVRVWLLHFPMIFFIGPDEIEEVLTNPIYLTKGFNYLPLFPWLGTGLLTSTGEKWQQRRKILQPAFHFSILKKFLEVFKSESKHLVHKLKEYENEELNIVPIILKFTINSACVTSSDVDDKLSLYTVDRQYLSESVTKLPQNTLLFYDCFLNNSSRKRSYNEAICQVYPKVIDSNKNFKPFTYLGSSTSKISNFLCGRNLTIVFKTSNTVETIMGTTLKSVDSVGKYYSSILEMGNICVSRTIEPWMMFDLLYSMTPMRWRQRKLLNYLHQFSSDIISRRKKEFQDFMKQNGSNFESYSERKRLAMLDILLSAQKERGIIDDEGIREEVDTFMFAGHDTTALSLIHTIMLLANNRIHQDKIYEEIVSIFGCKYTDVDVTTSKLQELKFMEMCIKESLRLYPSVPLIVRNPSEDVETKSGNIIPKDTSCFLSIYDIHRKEDTFPNPEVFDPYRFLPENISKRHPFSYIPFSGGPRNCIGQRFSILELKCALLEILRNFILEPVDTPETVEFLLDIVLRPAGPIRVKFKPRKA